jgi:aldehyde oxidoreductase
VRIVDIATGGGFGSKLDVSVQPLLGLVALKTGRPARMVYTRQESMASTTKRHPARCARPIGATPRAASPGMVFDGDFNTGPIPAGGRRWRTACRCMAQVPI